MSHLLEIPSDSFLPDAPGFFSRLKELVMTHQTRCYKSWFSNIDLFLLPERPSRSPILVSKAPKGRDAIHSTPPPDGGDPSKLTAINLQVSQGCHDLILDYFISEPDFCNGVPVLPNWFFWHKEEEEEKEGDRLQQEF